jgi:hypothetical protein
MPDRSRKSISKEGRRKKKKGAEAILADYGPALAAFLLFTFAAFVFLGIALFFREGMLLPLLLCPIMWLVAFLAGSMVASRDGHFIAIDYLESLGIVRFIIIFGFFGLYLLGYAILWFVAQIKTAMNRPKKIVPWLFLQAYAVIICVVVLCAGSVAQKTWWAPRNPQFAINDPPKTKDPDPFKNKDRDDRFKNNNPDDMFKKDREKLDRDNPFKEKTPEPAAKISGDPTLDAALADLESKDRLVAEKAADVLIRIPPNEHQAVVMKKLTELAQTTKGFTHAPIVRALCAWAGADDVPVLIEIAGRKGFDDGRKEAVKALGRFRDEKVVKALIPCLKDHFVRGPAEQALRQIGPFAESEILPLLNLKDLGLKPVVIKLLKDIGTQQSVPALEAIAATNNIILAPPAREALNAISARTKQ